MGRRYFCEYCNRAFADTLPTRKKHLRSIQHQRLRKLHYDSFKDSATLLAEEAQKIPCKIFFQNGYCKFGDNCKFSHINTEVLRMQITTSRPYDEKSCHVEAWLSEWRKKNPKKNENTKDQSTNYWLPRAFPPIGELPPSLCPPPIGNHGTRNNAEWGV